MPNLKCGICHMYTSLKEGDYFANTQCGHIFHYECIRDWICQSSKSNISTCPMCRTDVSLKSIVKLHGISPAELHTKRKVLMRFAESMQKRFWRNLMTPLNFKFVIIGDSGAGKTCLLHQYAKGVFMENQDATIGCDLIFKNVEVSGKIITLSIWDSGGQERYNSISPSYMRKAQGIFLVYDISNSDSMDNITKWTEMIDKYAPSNVVVMLLGNKSDLADKRKVPREKGEALAAALGIHFLETSARSALNVEACFRTLSAQVLEEMYRSGLTDGLFDSSLDSDCSNADGSLGSRSRCSC